MKISQNLASRKSPTFESLSKKEKPTSTMKPQDQHDTVKVGPNIVIQSRLTILTLMAVEHQRIGRKISDHLRKKGRKEPSTTY
jgi:hypothetical protein